ncbi:MAG: tyrosinase family protein [Aphanothece saxicola GSE-SYN-MK-01-06B]|jgi:tyrosinase|nr:tyrosinase family protein [Aphanothece saxicola GSE-SYN-MK-01-06B]
MATFTRRNAWMNGGTFANLDLFWYAKGVESMQALALDDPNSWWFFAAIHGQYVSLTEFPGWGFIAAPPQVPTSPVPSQVLIDQYWDQCQHQSWFFPPWHRGYLYALEAQIRTAIANLGGPADWALPYWNYFGLDDQYKIPPAFTSRTLPDGAPNPLFVSQRLGPKGDGDIYVEIPPASEACLSNTLFTGSNATTAPPGFGGPSTGFSNNGVTSGNLESNPHNLVHVDVGGFAPDQSSWGLMSDPGLAALDPVFYLHHANIDRLWAAWNGQGNNNPTNPNWLGGPAAIGQRAFAVPMPDAVAWVFTPSDVNSLSQMDYTYDDLAISINTLAPSALSRRLIFLGVSPMADVPLGAGSANQQNSELLGANEGALQIRSSGSRTTVKLESQVRSQVTRSLLGASLENLPDRVYLQVEDVRGSIDAYKLNVSVNQEPVGTVSLFGLRRASDRDGAHGGAGLNFILDITDIIDRIFMADALVADTLDVKIEPNHPVQEKATITVGRVSIYRQTQR